MPLTVLSLRWISLIVRTIYSESSSGERILRDKLNISFWIESYWMASLKCLRWAYSRCDDRRLSLNLPNCLKIGWNQHNILRCCLAKRSSKFYGERTWAPFVNCKLFTYNQHHWVGDLAESTLLSEYLQPLSNSQKPGATQCEPIIDFLITYHLSSKTAAERERNENILFLTFQNASGLLVNYSSST